MLITSTGTNILLRTDVVTENGNDGIEIGGNAWACGSWARSLVCSLPVSRGKQKRWPQITDNAHDNIIGGPQAAADVIPHNVFCPTALMAWR